MTDRLFFVALYLSFVGCQGHIGTDEVSLLQAGLRVVTESHAMSTSVTWADENPSMVDWPALHRSPHDPRVVISLSTVPGGVLGLGPTLQSLQNQSFRADAIELNLPRTSTRGLGNYPELPVSERDGIDVYRTDDWLALTNVIPTIQRAHALSAEVLLIIVDDDKVYPPSLVEDHVRAHRSQPRSASACRGYLMPPGGDISTSVFFPAWDELYHSVYGYTRASNQQVAVLTGSDSWSAPASLFSTGLWADLHMAKSQARSQSNETIETAASMMNDVWVSGQLSRQNVAKFVVPCRRQSQSSPSQLVASRESQNLPRKRQDLNQAVMQFYLHDWASSEIMSVAEVKRYPWLNVVRKHTIPKQRSFFDWVGRTVMRGFSVVFLGR